MRKKNVSSNNGGGIAALSSTVKLDTTHTAQLDKELAGQRERLIHLRDVLDESKHLLHDAQRAFDNSESRHLAGRIDARMLEIARNALDDARKRHAKASIECEEAERLVSDILPAAIIEAKNAALAQLRDTLRAETQAKAQQLAGVLAQAKALSDDLRLLQDEAVTHFTVNEMIRLKITLMGRMDLGEFGWVLPHAGIPNLACGWLTGQSVHQPSLYTVWQREAQAYLAKTPEQLAQEDVACREMMLARDERDYKEALVREAAQKKLDALIEARGGGRMPRGTAVLE